MYVLAGAISAFGYGICQPLIQTLSIKLVSPERRAVASNTNYIGVDAGFLIMPALAGVIVAFVQDNGGSSVAGYDTMFRVMTLPIVAALLVFLVYRKRILANLDKIDQSRGMNNETNEHDDSARRV